MGEENVDSFMDDDDDLTYGGKARFLFQFGGDLFGNSSSRAFQCLECNGIFSINLGHQFVVGIYLNPDAPKIHSERSNERLLMLRALISLNGPCSCKYHLGGSSPLWFSFFDSHASEQRPIPGLDNTAAWRDPIEDDDL